MKYRKDFVTNSSSSSYTCEVCGYETSGMDLCLSDCGMVECENGHTICEDHLRELSAKEILEAILKVDQDEMEWHKAHGYDYTPIDRTDYDGKGPNELWCEYMDMDDVRYSMNAKFCPICCLEDARDEDIAAYFLKKNNISREALLTIWRQEFGTYTKLKEYIS